MRRLIPFLIVAVGLLALAVDVLPEFPRPGADPPAFAETRLGLDLQGGLGGEYQAFTADGSTPAKGDMETIRTIIENRVNASGVAEPVVQTLGSDRIVVELPGATDQQEIRRLIGSPGRLDFVPIPTGTTPPGQDQPIDPTLPALFAGSEIDPGGVSPGFDQQTGARARQPTSEGGRAQGLLRTTAARTGDSPPPSPPTAPSPPRRSPASRSSTA